MTPRVLALPLVLAFVFLSGCVAEKPDGDASVFTYQLWVPVCALVVALVLLAAAAIALRARQWRIALPSLLLGIAAGVVVFPSLLADRARVSPEQISVRTGIWGMTAGGTVEMADVRAVRLTSKSSASRRGGSRSSYYLEFTTDGPDVKIPLSNAVSQAAEPRMLDAIKARGLGVIDNR